MRNFFDIFGPSGADEIEGLPTLGAAFMNAVAANESRGKWNVVYTPSGKVKTFNDYSKHPEIYSKILKGPNAGKLSSAAGKFQITKSTYDLYAPRLGITDFSPASQTKIAWYIAQTEYKRLTGENLLDVLATGDDKAIQKAARTLNKQWTSLPGGDEATHTAGSFLEEYRKQEATGKTNIPKVGLNNELIDAGDDEADSIMGYAPFSMAELRGRLPTELKRQSADAIKRHDSIVKEVGKLLSDGVVVPSGTRDLKNTAAQVIDFPAADLIAAGVTSMGMSSIPADPKGSLPKPSPLAPWGDRPTVAGRQVAPGVIDVGTAPASSPPPSKSATPTSTVSATPKAPVAGLKLPQVSQRTTPPLAPKVNPKSEAKAPAPAQPPMSVNDQKLAQLVKTMSRPATNAGIEKTTGLAGSAELPKGYKPPAGIIPGTEAKPAKSESKTSGNPANTTGAPVKPASKAQPAVNPVAVATGAKTNAPVSLSNPVLQPVKPSASKTPTPVTQTVSKPMPAGVLAAVEKVLAEPAKPAVKTTTQQPGVVEAKPKSTAVPAWGATVPAIGAKPAAKPATPAPATTAKPVMKVSAPLKKTGILEAGSVVTKAVKPAGDKVVQTDLKDLNLDNSGAKVGGAQTKKQTLSPLDLLGDIMLNGGAKTIGLIGSALSGNPVRDTQQAARQETLAKMARGEATTVIDQVKATTGMSSAAAYDYVASQNNSKSGTTSSGAPKTKQDGSSWAA